MKTFHKTLLTILIASLPAISHAQEICDSKLQVDVNCDGQQKIAVLGDSFVYGTGDANIKTLKGYIGRSQKALPKHKIAGYGVPGQQTSQLLENVKEALSPSNQSKLRDDLLEADVIFLDIGRNDRWIGLPKTAYKNLQTIRTLLRSRITELTGKTPVVVLSVLMLPNRGSQGPWVKEFDAIILKGHSNKNPANLRFDLVSKRLIGADQIHPTARGYSEISKVFVNYVKKKLPGLVRARSAASKKK